MTQQEAAGKLWAVMTRGQVIEAIENAFAVQARTWAGSDRDREEIEAECEEVLRWVRDEPPGSNLAKFPAPNSVNCDGERVAPIGARGQVFEIHGTSGNLWKK